MAGKAGDMDGGFTVFGVMAGQIFALLFFSDYLSFMFTKQAHPSL